jgi:hypothetical protein
MVAETARNVSDQIHSCGIVLTVSDSYGEQAHRTWAFCIGEGFAFGTIERYWGGLKMICSVLEGPPRTSFFTENGKRTTNKGLKANQTQRGDR